MRRSFSCLIACLLGLILLVEFRNNVTLYAARSQLESPSAIQIVAVEDPDHSAAEQGYWIATYGDDSVLEEFNDMAVTADGGMLVVGATEELIVYDPWLLKLRADGSILWQKAIDGAINVNDIRAIADNNYIIVGSNPNGAWAARFDDDGTFLWQKSYDSGGIDSARTVVGSGGGGFVVAGLSDNLPWIFGLNSDGTIKWQNFYGGTGDYFSISEIQTTNDGGVIIVGSYDPQGESSKLWVLRLNSSGEEVWDNTIGGSDSDSGLSVLALADGTFLVGGKTYRRTPVYGTYAWLLHLNSDGSVIWQKRYWDSQNLDENVLSINAIEPTDDGNYILAVTTLHDGPLLMKVTASGNILWAKGDYLPVINAFRILGLSQIGGGGFVGAASDGRNGWAFKINSEGDVPGCGIVQINSVAVVTTTDIIGESSIVTQTTTVEVDDTAFSTYLTEKARTTVCENDTNSDFELAERYLPYLHYTLDETYTKTITIESVLPHVDLVNGPSSLPKPMVTVDELINPQWNSSDAYLDFDGGNRWELGNIFRYVVCPENTCVSTVYARVHPVQNSSETVIQYWLFYYGNPGINYHEGDWEMVQVVLGALDEPIYAVYSRHGEAAKRLWQDVDKCSDGQYDHPCVYVAQGSHASYFRRGRYGLDYAGSTLIETNPAVILIPDNQPWLDFKGRWGVIGPSVFPEDDGPRGPSQKIVDDSENLIWHDPIGWAEDGCWDELCSHNGIGKIRVSIPSPFDVGLSLGSALDRAKTSTNASSADINGLEYFDNPSAMRRTVILHEVDPQAVYTVTISYRLPESSSVMASMMLTEPVTATLNYPDLEGGTVITASYSLSAMWTTSTTGTILVKAGADYDLEIDLDGNGTIDEELAPENIEIIPYDFIPPAVINDLAVVSTEANTVVLSWTAPGDDGHVGMASEYDVRHLERPITAENWAQAMMVIDPPDPQTAGMIETLPITNMPAGLWYFAVRAKDDAFQYGVLSNVVQVDLGTKLYLPTIIR